jgi:hypothetical protein
MSLENCPEPLMCFETCAAILVGLRGGVFVPSQGPTHTRVGVRTRDPCHGATRTSHLGQQGSLPSAELPYHSYANQRSLLRREADSATYMPRHAPGPPQRRLAAITFTLKEIYGNCII